MHSGNQSKNKFVGNFLAYSCFIDHSNVLVSGLYCVGVLYSAGGWYDSLHLAQEWSSALKAVTFEHGSRHLWFLSPSSDIPWALELCTSAIEMKSYLLRFAVQTVGNHSFGALGMTPAKWSVLAISEKAFVSVFSLLPYEVIWCRLIL